MRPPISINPYKVFNPTESEVRIFQNISIGLIFRRFASTEIENLVPSRIRIYRIVAKQDGIKSYSKILLRDFLISLKIVYSLDPDKQECVKWHPNWVLKKVTNDLKVYESHPCNNRIRKLLSPLSVKTP